MPRKTRVESSDGLYHIINRGNYRSDIFETDASKASFEKTLFETCKKNGLVCVRMLLLRRVKRVIC